VASTKRSNIRFAASGPDFSPEKFQRLCDYVVPDDDFRDVGVADTSDDLPGTVVVPSEIADSIDLDSKTDRFPEAYLGIFDGELDYITYEWHTGRYPVNAEVQGDMDCMFTIQAGRSNHQ
jgi:hypothetical protein